MSAFRNSENFEDKDLDKIKEKLAKEFHILLSRATTNETAHIVQKAIKSTTTLVDAKNTLLGVSFQEIGPSSKSKKPTNVEPQRKFVATQKRKGRPTGSSSLVKPTQLEQQTIALNLFDRIQPGE